jgi:PEP-CTERM motif
VASWASCSKCTSRFTHSRYFIVQAFTPFAGDAGEDQSGYGRTAPTGTIQVGGEDGGSYRAPGIWSSSVDPVATPEPSNLLLLSSGLIGLGFMKRKVFQN